MGLLQDAKKLILGETGDENEEDLKTSIEKAISEGKIDKAQAALLMECLNNVKKSAKELEKKQISVISLEDGTQVSAEDAKKKKEELAKKKEEEKQRRLASQNTKKTTEKASKNNNTKIDRKRLQEEMLKEEIEENVKPKEREENN